MTIGVMFSSYRNHILWLSIYFAALAHAVTGWTSSLVSLLVTLFLVVGINLELRYMFQRRTLPPGDSGLPFVGQLPIYVSDPAAFFQSHVKRYGDPCTFNLYMYPCVLLVKDEDVAWAIKQERKGNMRAFMLEHFQRVVGKEAIVFQYGAHHKRLRKIFEPAFTPLAIRDYLSVMDHVAQETLARLSKSGEFCEPREWALLALRIFCRCAFGEVDEDENKKL